MRDLTESFEENRAHLRSVAYRMLDSLAEADDAVQEAWLRLSRSDTNEVENLKGWLTTVVARICLDMLRSRKSLREESFDPEAAEPIVNREGGVDPEDEALLVDSVGLALLVVLNMLDPAERLAFVLHDTFGLPFDEIARIVSRSPTATRQLASRARRRVRGAAATPNTDIDRQREVIGAFLTALRAADFEGLVAVLDPDVVVHADVPSSTRREIRGAENWAKGAIAFAKNARFIQPALVDGAIGLVLAPRGRLVRALRITISRGKISAVEVVADRERLARLEIAVLDA